MRTSFPIVSVLFVSLALAQGPGPDTKISGTNDKCAEHCDKTYAPHTNENSDEGKACRLGCRLFTIVQFSGDNRENETEVREKCSDACGEAHYVEAGKLAACNSGCEHQVKFTSGKVEVVLHKGDPLFEKASGMMQGMFDRVQQSFGSDFGSFFQGNHMFSRMNQQMERMQKWMDEMMGPSLLQSREGEEEGERDGGKRDLDSLPSPLTEQDILNPLYGYGRRVSQKSAGSKKPKIPFGEEFNGPEVGNKDADGRNILHVEMIDRWSPREMNALNGFDEIEENESFRNVDPSEAVDPDASWLACLARRAQRLSAVTRWLVCLALFLCILCMIWIGLAIIRTAPRRRVLYARADGVKLADVDLVPTSDKKALILNEELGLNHSDGPPPAYHVLPPVHKAPPKEKPDTPPNA